MLSGASGFALSVFLSFSHCMRSLNAALALDRTSILYLPWGGLGRFGAVWGRVAITMYACF